MLRLTGLILVLLAAPVSAQITVTSTADVAADDGECTLREAIVASNTDTASGAMSGECAAGNGEDTVRIAVAPGSTIALTADLPDATQTWTLEGPTGRPDGVIIDGGGTHRIFVLDSNNLQQTHTLRGLTIQNGLAPAGGGLLVGYQDHCVLEDLAVLDNVSTNGAGGIYTGEEGSCTMDRLLVMGNEAQGPSGAGGIRISNGTTATIRNSTIADNHAPESSGGGILVGRFSAPIAQFDLIQSTVSGNSAAGGGGGIIQIGANGASLVQASTIVGNSVTDPVGAGGGVSFSWDVTFESTVIAGNTAVRDDGRWNDLSLGVNRTTSNGGNLIGINGFFTSDFPTGSPNANGDWVGTVAAPVDAQIDALADNGGPMPTHAPLDGSPMLDAGVCPDTGGDQRGSIREVDEPGIANANGDACDIGAVEGLAFAVDRAAAPLLAVSLDAPFPSPTTGASTVRFTLDRAQRARLVMVDALGREVARLYDREAAAGTHTVAVPSRGLAPGLYFLRLGTEAGSAARPLVVAR